MYGAIFVMARLVAAAYLWVLYRIYTFFIFNSLYIKLKCFLFMYNIPLSFFLFYSVESALFVHFCVNLARSSLQVLFLIFRSFRNLSVFLSICLSVAEYRYFLADYWVLEGGGIFLMFIPFLSGVPRRSSSSGRPFLVSGSCFRSPWIGVSCFYNVLFKEFS